MIPKEIERKYTIKILPKQIEEIFKIEQKHIYRDLACSIRVRKSINLYNNKTIYTHTIKAKGNKQKKYGIYEIEKEITKEEFESFETKEKSKTIEKYRCIILLEDGLKAEVDIFSGWLKGLVVAEVEFKNIKQAENFEMPNWFNKEISHNEFSNRKISEKTREEVIEMIGKEQLIINENIYKEFKKEG